MAGIPSQLWLLAGLGAGAAIVAVLQIFIFTEMAAAPPPTPTVAHAALDTGQTALIKRATPTRPVLNAPFVATALATPSPEAAPGTPPPPVTPANSGVPIRLVAPAIDLDTPVETWGTVEKDGKLTWETRPFVAGWYHFTAQVGQNGNAIIAGHLLDRQGGRVFERLHELTPGDEVYAYTQDGAFKYRVEQVVVAQPSDIGLVQQTDDPTLTLITCGGAWRPDQQTFTERLVVIAKRAW